jgi:hypothetical protein
MFYVVEYWIQQELKYIRVMKSYSNSKFLIFCPMNILFKWNVTHIDLLLDL